MKNSTNAQNTRIKTIAQRLFTTLIIIASLALVARAEDIYECTIQENGQCLIDMSEVLDEDIYSIDDALKYCEKINGSYAYEEDVCILD